MLPVIVCIDDETHNNQALERLLRKKYQVYSAISPTEGLELIQKHQPAVIISDQRMPQMTGVEVLEKSIALSPDSIRLLLTGYTDIESVISAINEGQIYRYLTKPWEPQDLIITIDKAYETYLLRQELQKQNEQLKSLDKLKTDFMVLVSHELKTPLTAIVSFMDLLKEEIKTDDTKVYFEHIQKNTTRLHKLIEDILFITKLKGSSPSEGQTTDVVILEDLKTLIAKTKGSLKISIDGEPLTVALRRDYFIQLAQRLIENIQFHGKPGTSAQISVGKKENLLTLTLKNEMTQPLHIKPEDFFALFSRNENIMNHTKGTGLGLGIVFALVQSMGGTIDLKTESSLFEIAVHLPCG